jgi:hypothetical protein
MESSPKPTAKKAPEVFVLHCLNPACRGLLAYEVDSDNVLYVDLSWTATHADGQSYFPCPTCGGRNIIEEFRDAKGRLKHRAARFENANRPADDLELIPRGVRDKLDRVGIKLHLREWQDLSRTDRERLRDLPCETAEQTAAYAAAVEHLVLRLTGKAAERLRLGS